MFQHSSTTMAFLDHNGGAEFPYAKKELFWAIRRAVGQLDGFEVDSADPLTGRIVVKTGISFRTWGEHIPITLTEVTSERTHVSVSSSSKIGALGGVWDWGKNKENIERILTEASRQLRAHPPNPTKRNLGPPQTPALKAADDVAVRLTKLKSLFEQELVTAAEYDARKAEILKDI